MVEEPVQLGRGRATLHQPVPQRVILGYTPRQYIDGQPPSVVFKLCLRDQPGAAVGATGVLRLYQPRRRGDFPDPRHPQDSRTQFVQQRSNERTVIAVMRVPVAVQRTEPGRCERLVDGRVVLEPGISSGHRRGIGREGFWERGVEQMRAARAAAMMKQRGHWPNAGSPQECEPLVGPRPVSGREAVWRDPLPQDGIPHRAKANRCKASDVVRAIVMPRLSDLIDIPLADAIDRALDAAPELDRFLPAHADCAIGSRARCINRP